MTTIEHLGHSFKKLNLLMEQSMNRQLQELDLTGGQGRIIGYLTHAKEPPCARDLENTFGLSHATVSGILSRMEGKGFIEVRPDPSDRRIKRICLLEKGRACSKEIARRIDEAEKAMTDGFSPEELALFRAFLRRAIDNLGEFSQDSNINREE